MVERNESIRMQQLVTDAVFDVSGRISLSDEEVLRRIVCSANGSEPHEIGSWAKHERALMPQKLKAEGLSIRQIERATGISRGVVAKS